MHKQVDPDIPGQSQNDGKKHDERANDGQKGVELIKAYKHITYDECGYSKCDSYTIAHIHGTIKEGRLYFIFGIAMAAAIMHF